MPRTCTTCSNPNRKSIDARIADGEPYRSIANRFGLNHVSVSRHGKNHVHPFLESIELQATAAVLERVMAYRDEVNLPLPEKSKYIENKLWADLDAATGVPNRMAILKEINKQQIEQAKLAGAYVKEKANPTDAAEAARDVAARLVSEYGWSQERAEAFAAKRYIDQSLISDGIN